MKIVDANIILRYLLNDHEEHSEEAADIIDNNQIFLQTEVLCEVIYVLEKVYEADRNEIESNLRSFIHTMNIDLMMRTEILNGLRYYALKKLDFVDCLLAAYSEGHDTSVYTFDKKLKKFIEELAQRHCSFA